MLKMTAQNSTSEPLQYCCTIWRESSQAAANHYARGGRLWKKGDLIDIEKQLAESKTRNYFTVRSIDGIEVQIKNPMFGEESPIW